MQVRVEGYDRCLWKTPFEISVGSNGEGRQRDGKKVMQFLEGGRYIAVVADGKVHLYAPKN